ncbi:MAG: TaqI-like C-terminal specificity domain-containing protein, partial [Eubacteriales bacterium]|nr:TaqI-like C-terminal specificity domain-containing protein [Eubacteriales bacterium]
KIYKTKKCQYLKGQSTFALGIITGNNKKLISGKKNSMNEKILKGTDIDKYKIKDSDRYVVFCPESFQQSAPEKYYRASEKLLYRFISDRLVFAYDNEQRLSLNSCNILIPNIPGMDIKYILAVLNSSVAQFVYSRRFHSVKVLKSHLEQLPIPEASKEEQAVIAAAALRLICLDKRLRPEQWQQLYLYLDKQIASLYGLSEEEYERICLGVM